MSAMRMRKPVEANDGSYSGMVLDAFDRLSEQLGVLGISEVDVEAAAVPAAQVVLEDGDILGAAPHNEGAELGNVGKADVAGSGADRSFAVLLDEVDAVSAVYVIEIEEYSGHTEILDRTAVRA